MTTDPQTNLLWVFVSRVSSIDDIIIHSYTFLFSKQLPFQIQLIAYILNVECRFPSNVFITVDFYIEHNGVLGLIFIKIDNKKNMVFHECQRWIYFDVVLQIVLENQSKFNFRKLLLAFKINNRSLLFVLNMMCSICYAYYSIKTINRVSMELSIILNTAKSLISSISLTIMKWVHGQTSIRNIILFYIQWQKTR